MSSKGRMNVVAKGTFPRDAKDLLDLLGVHTFVDS